MNSKQALVVDDSRSARKVLERMLQKADMAVTTVEDAESALDYLQNNQPNIIFMDHMMPGMDGLQATQALRQHPHLSEVPTIMYTSKDDADYLAAAKASGANDVLPKPAKQDKLEALISLYLSELSEAPQTVSSQPENTVHYVTREDLTQLQAHLEGLLTRSESKQQALGEQQYQTLEVQTHKMVEQLRPTDVALFKQLQPSIQRLCIQITQKILKQQRQVVEKEQQTLKSTISDLSARHAHQVNTLSTQLDHSKRLTYFSIGLALLCGIGVLTTTFL